MHPYESDSHATRYPNDVQGWFTKPGPTESFRRTAPKHLLDNRETAPAISIDPSFFTKVGPTADFVTTR